MLSMLQMARAHRKFIIVRITTPSIPGNMLIAIVLIEYSIELKGIINDSLLGNPPGS